MTDTGPAPRPVSCATCGAEVDALRAPRVRIFGQTFHYFCSASHAELFDPRSPVRFTAPERSSDRFASSNGLAAPERVAPRSEPAPSERREQHVAPPSPAQAAPPSARSLESPAVPVDTEIGESAAPSDWARAPTSEAPNTLRAGEVPPSTLRTGEVPSSIISQRAPEPPEEAPPAAPEEAPEPRAVRQPSTKRAPSARYREQLPLLLAAAFGGLLSVGVLLMGNMPWVQSLRAVVLVAAALLFLWASIRRTRDARELDPFSELAPPLVAVGVAVAARLGNDPATAPALMTAGLLVASVAFSKAAVSWVSAPFDAKRRALESALSFPARRMRGGASQECSVDELRPGEEVVVMAGEFVPTDGTVIAGNADVVPWFESQLRQRVGPGAPVVAGAKVQSGTLRVIAGWTGGDRAFVRLLSDKRRRADLHAAIARAGYLVAQRAAPLAALLAAIAALAVHQSPFLVVLTVAATYGALANPGVAELAALRTTRGALEALDHGIAFRSAEELDRAGRITVAALCARGTVLLGEPEVASIEPLHSEKMEAVLALAAGGESVVSHPVATAVLRAARARGVRPDGTRNHNAVPGLGVTAIASSGKSLIVGSRALMLREKVSIALAERRITDLEALGQTALLVAVDGRLIGILALQDGLRPGSRAAVQHLLDVGVEPVLLSGDSRETTEAIGRSIDIEHVRPELPAAQRGDEVRRLSDGGAIVAVVGRSPVDDSALGAADVSVALGAAAATNAEWSIGLVTEDVRDAARAIRIAHRTRDGQKRMLAFCLLPAGIAALTVAFGLLPTAAAPLAALVGTLASTFRAREE